MKTIQAFQAVLEKGILLFFLDDEGFRIESNPHKTSKSPEFFAYFDTLNINTLYLKALGYKTFLTLKAKNIEVYLVPNAIKWNAIKADELVLLTQENAESLCTLGHTQH
ncbi:MAG: hypothetical protein Q9M36_12525 [Sulfurovum sp.]|nr:hypothetical protein [Sulfurovum sp.]